MIRKDLKNCAKEDFYFEGAGKGKGTTVSSR